jgi:hypothetical protein
MRDVNDPIQVTSSTFPRTTFDRILREARPFTDQGHYLYPADEHGIHTKGFFAIEPVSRSPEFIDAIADDVARWAHRESIDIDVVFAPAQRAVRPLAEGVGKRLGKPRAYWEYLPSGRFGDRLVEGTVDSGAAALALNGVSLQGRCVGLRLPQFVEGLGGTVTAAAVFAKGTEDLVRKTEDRLGPRFYSTLRVDVPIYAPEECPVCASTHLAPVSWREFAEGRRP